MKILLVGLPGAGCSTVGALVAKRLGWPFLDDDVLLERTGAPAKALNLLLAMPGSIVAVIPDGVIEDEASRTRISTNEAHVVWLRCAIPLLARRVGGRLGADPAGILRKLTADHLAFYEALATQVVDTDANPAGAAAKLIIDSQN